MMKNCYMALACLAGAMCSAVEMQDVAHRGIHDELPENTVEAMKLAYDSGATWVETDFHKTKAGPIVCIHDEKALQSLTGIEKKIADFTEEDLRTIDLGAKLSLGRPFRIPLLADVLKIVPPHGILQAEIKRYEESYPEEFDAAAKAAGLTEKNFVISSFNLKSLTGFKEAKPAYVTMWLVPSVLPDVEKIISSAQAAKVKYVALPPAVVKMPDVDCAFADRIRAAGFDVRMWGVNSFEALQKAFELKITGFTSNHYKKMFELAKKIDGLTLLK